MSACVLLMSNFNSSSLFCIPFMLTCRILRFFSLLLLGRCVLESGRVVLLFPCCVCIVCVVVDMGALGDRAGGGLRGEAMGVCSVDISEFV